MGDDMGFSEVGSGEEGSELVDSSVAGAQAVKAKTRTSKSVAVFFI